MTGRYETVARDIGRLVDEKNKAYGSAFAKAGEILRVLYPNGLRPDQFDDALVITRILDKMFRIAISKHAFGESPWQDIAGYAVLKAAEPPGPAPEEIEVEEQPDALTWDCVQCNAQMDAGSLVCRSCHGAPRGGLGP